MIMKTQDRPPSAIRKTYIKLFVICILVALAVLGTIKRANAQTGNFSDWNVPPPLPPGNVTKTTVPGKNCTHVIIAPFVDVPVPAMPKTSPVQVPRLGAVSLTAPAADAPQQPGFPQVSGNLPQTPNPAAPDAPALPQQNQQDAATPTVINLPEPSAPSMLDFPKLPDVSTGNARNLPMPIPILPGVQHTGLTFAPLSAPGNAWSIPGIPQNISMVLVLPNDPGNTRPAPKPSPKTKSNRHRSSNKASKPA
jgi:hypothetical protein